MTPTTPSPISDQAAGEPKWRTELSRIAEDYQPDSASQAILALEEMRQALRELLESTACDCGVACRDDGVPDFSKHAKWPEGYCLDPNGNMTFPSGAHEHWSFGYDMGYAEALALRTTVIQDALAKLKAAPASPAASVLSDEQISAIVDEFDACHWVDGECRIEGRDMMKLCRALLEASTGGDRT